eukprot:TRINITY_DN12793_c0_g1_i1.p1 TRINITY_DN12793_c0_g1~~TRINITY_DN12793_c0_g1_i1.p1  ORF type:complete len:180 (-),score=6.01 TRINITY_DN12793_c0_g1_i1:69-608(-)
MFPLSRTVKTHLGCLGLGVGIGVGVSHILRDSSVSLRSPWFHVDTNCTDAKALESILKTYDLRINNLSGRSASSKEAFFTSQDKAEKKKILQSTISHYLVPTSEDRLFGVDIVLYNGKGKPTILLRKDYDVVRKNWAATLQSAGVQDLVDQYRIGTKCSAFPEKQVGEAQKAVMTKLKW